MSWTPERCDGCGESSDTFGLVLDRNGTYFAFCRIACLLRWLRAVGYTLEDEE